MRSPGRIDNVLDERCFLDVVPVGDAIQLHGAAGKWRPFRCSSRIECPPRARVRLVVQHVVQPGDVAPDGLQMGAELHQSVHRPREVPGQALKGHQAADGQRAVQDPQPPDTQHGDEAEEGEQRRGDVGHHRDERQTLLRVQRVGMHAGPAGEEVAFGSVRLQRLDHLNALDGHAGQLSLFLEQAAAGVVPGAGGDLQHHEIARHDGRGDQRQRYVVGQHHRRVEPHRQRVDRVHGQLVRQEPGDAVVRRHPADEVSRVALAEERHRQADQVPEEAGCRDDGELGLHPGQEGALQPDQRALQDGREHQPSQQRVHPVRVSGYQHVVDEHLDHRRHGETGDEQGQRGQGAEGERAPGAAEARAEAPQDARLRAGAAEVRASPEGEADARVAFFELLQGQAARSVARVVDVEALAPDPLEHDEMIEVPEEDHRERELEQILTPTAEPLCVQAVLARRPEHAVRVRPIA